MLTITEHEILRSNIHRYELEQERLYPNIYCFDKKMQKKILKASGLNHSPTNDEKAKVEVYEFMTDKPDKYFAYVQENHSKNNIPTNITTWMGDNLGRIYSGSPYWSNFGDKRIPITVHAINGLIYHGTYYQSAGDYCRIRVKKIKGKMISWDITL